MSTKKTYQKYFENDDYEKAYDLYIDINSGRDKDRQKASLHKEHNVSGWWVTWIVKE